MKKKKAVKWAKKPTAMELRAAGTYLSLLYPPPHCKKTEARLGRAGIATYKASDIFRASGVKFSAQGVGAERKKMRSGKEISPLLLVRDGALGKVIIADGYHRLCAVYEIDEDIEVPCSIV